jgi:hypothetical protein
MLILSEHREPKDLSALLPFRAHPIPRHYSFDSISFA